MFAIAGPSYFPALFFDAFTPYYMISEYHGDHLMENMDDLQDFFDEVDDPREPGVTRTPLRVTPVFPGTYWPNFTANAGKGWWRRRNESSLLCVPHACVTAELNPSFPTGANWCAIPKYQCA